MPFSALRRSISSPIFRTKKKKCKCDEINKEIKSQRIYVIQADNWPKHLENPFPEKYEFEGNSYDFAIYVSCEDKEKNIVGYSNSAKAELVTMRSCCSCMNILESIV